MTEICSHFTNNEIKSNYMKNIINYKRRSNNKNKIKSCFYCGSTKHLCRDCPKEKHDSTNYKLQIGKWAEKYVSQYNCPNCKCHNLKFLGNHTPSLDIVCENCGHMIEVKSKCLSINKLPNDIWMYHGNYDFYRKRVSQGLTFVIVIYAVNRQTKNFHVRKVLYINNQIIQKEEKIKVLKNNDNKNSKIIIPNINKLDDWNILINTIEAH